jgi:hypothetical protein
MTLLIMGFGILEKQILCLQDILMQIELVMRMIEKTRLMATFMLAPIRWHG